MFSFGFFFYWEKEMNCFLLSPSKWIDNLLFINHSQSDKQFFFKTFMIQVLSVWRYDPVSFNDCGKLFIYIKKRSGPCGTPQFISLASENFSSVSNKNSLFERYDWNHLMTGSLKQIHSIFCKSTVWSNVSNVFVGRLGFSQSENLCPFLSR